MKSHFLKELISYKNRKAINEKLRLFQQRQLN